MSAPAHAFKAQLKVWKGLVSVEVTSFEKKNKKYDMQKFC